MPNVPRRRRNGRRILAKGRDRSQAIIDAAEAELRAGGIEGLTLRAVARRAGIRLGNLQYYYPTRDALVAALVERTLARAGARVAERGDAVDPADGVGAQRGIDGLVAGLLADHEQRDESRTLIHLWALAEHDRDVAAALRAHYQRYWRAIVAALLPGATRPRAERRAALVVALVEGLLIFRARERPYRLPILGLERELRALVSVLARG